MDHSQHGKMDHSAHAGHGGHKSTFHFTLPLTYLFDALQVATTGQLVGYCILTIVLGVLVEVIKDYRINCGCTRAKLSELSRKTQILHQIKDSLLYLVQTTLSYALMLIAMTF